jgi:conjugative relaxase-like TrwC/TraI family protein
VLSICKVARGQEEYYLATAATGRDHFEGLVEAPGVWLGGAVERRGLTGVAEPRAVRMLFAGLDPLTGEPLVPEPARRRIAAYDCTFSTPKSVSLTQALSPDPQVREEMRLGHEAAVSASLSYLEREAPAIRLSTPDGPRVVRGGDMVGVGFVHRLSRAGDPHLHTHVLIANLVADPTGGRGHTLDATSLFLEIRTTGALYETHLRFELTQRLGVEWQPLNGRCWSDLEGLDRPAIERFSRRSLQILDAVRAEGWQGPAARRAMAERTRPPKDRARPYAEVIEECRLRLREAGVSDTRLKNICHRLTPDSHELPAGGAHDDRWKDEALRKLTWRTVDGSFSARDVIRARCATAQEGRSVAGVERDALDLLSDAQVVRRPAHGLWLRGGTTGSVPVGRIEASYTTLHVAATESRIGALAGSMITERSEALTVVRYGPGERLAALDALSRAAASWTAEGRRAIALAPGRWSAAGIESASGIDAVALPAARLAAGMEAAGGSALSTAEDLRISTGSVVVLAEAQRYGPAVLEGLLESCKSAGASVVLLAPRWAFEAASALATTVAAELTEPSLGGRIPSGTTLAEHRFGGVAVTLVPSLRAALDETRRQLSVAGDGATAGSVSRAIVVTGEEAIARTLRAMPGAEAGAVVHARDLKSVLEARRAGAAAAPPQLIVVGGASVLRQGATAAPGAHRSHVVVAPGIACAGSPAGLGRAAEAARPKYLTSCLGNPPVGPAERGAWRSAAVSIETYRDRWRITDDRRAFGGASPAAERSAQRQSELLVAERLAEDARSLGRRARAREVEPPALGLGLGR